MAKNKKVETVKSVSSPKSVTIQAASNGYTVSMWTDKGYKNMIAKSESEAMKHAKSLLGVKKK
jgi:hypothetical protein